MSMSDKPDSKSEYQGRLNEAADWWVLLSDEDVQPADKLAHQNWLRQHPDNQKAFNELQILWDEFDTQENESALSARVLNQVLSEQASYIPEKSKTLLGLGFFALTSLSCYLYQLGVGGMSADYYTLTGESQSVLLEDGSRVYMDTNTAFDLEFSARERRLVLHKGQVYADVTTAAKRPFIVQTPNSQVTALGTRFSVKTSPYDTQVVVTESRVELCVEHAQIACVRGGEGETMRWQDEQLYGPESVNTHIATAWLEHRLVANKRSASDVLQELEAYFSGVIVYQKSELEQISVSGVYPTNDIAQALTMLSRHPRLEVRSVSDFVSIIRVIETPSDKSK